MDTFLLSLLTLIPSILRLVYFLNSQKPKPERTHSTLTTTLFIRMINFINFAPLIYFVWNCQLLTKVLVIISYTY